MMGPLKFSRKHLGIPYTVFMALFVVFPLLLIVYYAFTDQNGNITFINFIEFFSSSANLASMLVSFMLAILTTVICLIIAYPVAYILARTNMNKNGIMLLLFILPMWINFVLRTAAMKELMFSLHMFDSNKNSFVNTLIGMVYDYLPFTVLPIYTVLAKLDKNVLEASADLGASPIVTLVKVTIPLSMPGVVSAITMVFLPTTTSYVISDTLGNGNVTIIGKLIENQFSTMYNWHAGSAIAMILLVLIFATMLIGGQFSEKNSDIAGGRLW